MIVMKPFTLKCKLYIFDKNYDVDAFDKRKTVIFII